MGFHCQVVCTCSCCCRVTIHNLFGAFLGVLFAVTNTRQVLNHSILPTRNVYRESTALLSVVEWNVMDQLIADSWLNDQCHC